MGEICAIRMFGPSHCFSTKPICVEFYPCTSHITIAGDRTARWAKQFHAARQGPSLGKHTERSSRNLCLEGHTTFTVLLHDKFLRPTAMTGLSGRSPTWDIVSPIKRSAMFYAVT